MESKPEYLFVTSNRGIPFRLMKDSMAYTPHVVRDLKSFKEYIAYVGVPERIYISDKIDGACGIEFLQWFFEYTQHTKLENNFRIIPYDIHCTNLNYIMSDVIMKYFDRKNNYV